MSVYYMVKDGHMSHSLALTEAVGMADNRLLWSLLTATDAGQK